MPDSFLKLFSEKKTRAIRSLVFFAVFYLYLWCGVETHLLYHGGGQVRNFPHFFRGWEFFGELMLRPGGLVEYLSAFLAQFFYFSEAGAFVVTVQAWLFFVCTNTIIKAFGADRLRWVRFLPPILLLIPYTQYIYQFLAATALLTGLLFVCLYLKTASQNRFARLIVFMLLSVVLHAMAGGVYLLFVLICIFYELLCRRCGWMVLLYLLSAFVGPYAMGIFVFDASDLNIFTYLLPFSRIINVRQPRQETIVALYLVYVLLLLVVLVLRFWQDKAGPKAMAKIFSWYWQNNKLRWLIDSLILLVATGSVVVFFYDSTQKRYFEVDYYASRRMWPKTIEVSRQVSSNFRVTNAVDRALYHTGRLNSDGFSLSQHVDALLMESSKFELNYWWKIGTYIDLGLMNPAERQLNEAIELYGPQPVLIKRLALVNMVKNNISAAKVYLGALSRTLFEAEWAKDYLSLIASDPELLTDKRIQHLRSMMPTEDLISTGFKFEELMLTLLAANKQHRMAFEYLMMWYLLKKDLEKFADNIWRMADFDYQSIPTHWEEAILTYTFSRKIDIDLHDRRVSPRSRLRFDGFIQIVNRYRGDRKAAFKDLSGRYGNSYFFYHMYGFSGMQR